MEVGGEQREHLRIIRDQIHAYPLTGANTVPSLGLRLMQRRAGWRGHHDRRGRCRGRTVALI